MMALSDEWLWWIREAVQVVSGMSALIRKYTDLNWYCAES
ncbi:hypothetical protein HOE425_331313 [Hoeflea sp. EC-HK425]|nr:hypothetical protein HOE425_331313 [Hoeflea sp. EC-HK425]